MALISSSDANFQYVRNTKQLTPDKIIQYLRDQGFIQAANSLQGYIYKEEMKQDV